MKAGQMLLGHILSGALFAATAAPALAKPSNSLETFNFQKEPAKADWRYFLKEPEANRQKLWAYHTGQGHLLKDWAWGWRLGWVRACAESKEEFCGQIMRQALADKAMVVRAEAATRLGRRFDGSKDPKIVAMLGEAYRLKGNVRNGKPLFVQNRILFALRQIGGPEALNLGRQLAASHAVTRDYWQKIARAEVAE